MMPLLSVIIPFWSKDPELDAMLAACVGSLTGYEELVVVTNEPLPDGRAHFAKYVNLGLRLARGEYRLVLNSDTKLLAGTLRDLCSPGTITTPTINGDRVCFHGCAFCVPATVYEKHGGLDEGYVGCWEDQDYCNSMYRAGVPIQNVPSVSIWHQGGATYRSLDEEAMQHGANKARFIAKWGRCISLSELMDEDRRNGCFVEPVTI